ncbi:hypothetical protein [Aliiroseovarius sp. YM-037]|uniref:hypothetical protein n=1 Tax=Aliiroseovarius sp. YM-037 TaxID=3341728 RepID=UPI003A805BD9
MTGALLPVSFVIPVLLTQELWSMFGESGIGKVVAIMSGVIVFVVLKAFDLYFSHALIQAEQTDAAES